MSRDPSFLSCYVAVGHDLSYRGDGGHEEKIQRRTDDVCGYSRAEVIVILCEPVN